MKISLKFFCFFFTVFGTVSAQSIHESVLAFQNLDALKNASWSIKAKNLSADKELISVNSKTSLIPASTLKSITTGIALFELGSDYKFRTDFAYSGKITDSVLNGDLLIIGGGDPSFGNPDFYDFDIIQKWIEILKLNGVKSVAGNLIVLDNHYSGILTPATWVYQDLGNYYGASPSSLTFQNNTFSITFGQNQILGGETEILNQDNYIGLSLKNEVRSGPVNSGDRAYVYGCPKCDQYSVRGTIPAGSGTFTIKASIPDPITYFMNLFEKRMGEIGIDLKGQKLIKRIYENAFTILDSLYSIPLIEIMRETNVNSNNLYAEHILLEMAKKNGEENPSDMISNYYKLNLDDEGLFVHDGSGLSRYNAITTTNQIAMLEYLHMSDLFTTYINTLPLGGKEGTIKNMFHSKNGTQFFIKSGTLSRVKAFTGYIRKASGEIIAFSFIVNNFNGKSSEISSEMEKVIIGLSE